MRQKYIAGLEQNMIKIIRNRVFILLVYNLKMLV